MIHYIFDKSGEFTVFIQDGVINAIYKNDWGNSPEKKVFQFVSDEKLFNKLTGYKTVRGLLAFCEKHLTLVFHLPRDLNDRTRTVSALGDDVPNQSLPSDDCSDSPILPPVAVSSPAASDTLFISLKSTGHGSKDEVIDLAVVDSNENIVFESLFNTKVPNRIFLNSVVAQLAKDNFAPFFDDDICYELSSIFVGKRLVTYHAPFLTKIISNSIVAHCREFSPCLFFSNLPLYGLMYDYARHWGELASTGLPINQSLDDALIQQKCNRIIFCGRARDEAINISCLYGCKSSWLSLEGVLS